jgi:D-alanyl-D-alanine carboxypeptidase (penicillin-binding protein 5/6)
VRKLLLFLVVISLLFFPIYLGYSLVFARDENSSIASPLPSFLTSKENNQVSTLNLWEPFWDLFEGQKAEVPSVTAKSVLMYDLTQKKIIYEKNSDRKYPMASLTKIMTAIVALENPKSDNKYRVLKKNLVGENTMGLSAGETLSLNELIYGLILHSGNDASETLASHFPAGRSGFIKAMNDKAKSIGIKNTNFTNPSGLEGDGDQHTTARDLLVMTRFALASPIFSNVVSTVDYLIPATPTHKEYFLKNETNLLTTYPGVKGVKTGYTGEAGYCLVTYLDYEGHKIVGIIMGSENRREEMKALLDYSLKTLGTKPPEHT